MKVVLAALNSQYIHTNLAVRSLAAACAAAGADVCGDVCGDAGRDVCGDAGADVCGDAGGDVCGDAGADVCGDAGGDADSPRADAAPPEIREYHINQQGHWILGDLLQQAPDMIGFSCYIWNIEQVLRLAEDVKKANPRVQILLGGPEVSFDAFERMRKHAFIDYILCGEGEETLPRLLNGEDCAKIPGLVYRESGVTAGDDAYQRVSDLGRLPGMWTEESLAQAKNRIVYYETSRGCPFTCEYCLSGAVGGGVRERPLEQVQADLARMSACGVPLVKLADRTFNANPERAKELLRRMLESTGDMRIHLELAADLLDGETLALLSSGPKGKFQIEAGIQSFNEKTLGAISRKTDLPKLRENVAALMNSGKVHVHLDLIAGLPYEDMDSFARSFDQAYALSPHRLQLGFLKLLKGSGLAGNAGKYGVQSRGYPPYEVLRTVDMSAAEILILKGIAEILDRYYNSGRALWGLRFIMEKRVKSAFEFYRRFSEFCHSMGCLNEPVSGLRQFEILIKFAERVWSESEVRSERPDDSPGNDFLTRFLVWLKLDYWAGGIKGKPPAAFLDPPFIRDESRIREKARQLLAEGRVTKKQFSRAVFDILPIHPLDGTIQDTVVMIEHDCRDEVTGRRRVTLI